MTYNIQLSVNDDGFWLAWVGGKSGKVTATPGEAVTSLLVAAGVEVNTGARVIQDTPTTTLKLFVWADFCPDYAAGLAVAIAETESEARKLVLGKMDYAPTGFRWGDVVVYPLEKIAFAAEGR